MHPLDGFVSDVVGEEGIPFLVGGAVRDEVIGLPPKDRDYMVVGMGQGDLTRLFARAGCSVQTLEVAKRPVGVRVQHDDHGSFDVALPRRHEVSTGPLHTDFDMEIIQPDQQAGMTVDDIVYEDSVRRDFTMNALYRELRTDALVDHHGGEADALGGVVRMLSQRVIAEDPLRILRGLYLLGLNGGRIEDGTFAEMARSASLLEDVSAERVGDELDKVMLTNYVDEAVGAAFHIGAFRAWLPELQQCYGFDQQSPFHDDLLHVHLTKALEQMSYHTEWAGDRATREDRLCMRWAALLHDVGKPYSGWDPGDGRLRYFQRPHDKGGCNRLTLEGVDHAYAGGRVAHNIMRRLRRPNWQCERVSRAVMHHMIKPSERRSAARRLRALVGDDVTLRDAFFVRWSDLGAKGDCDEHVDELVEYWDAIQDAMRSPCFVSDLAVDGNDMAALGLEGRAIGEALEALVREVIGDPGLNDREWLLGRASRMARKGAVA